MSVREIRGWTPATALPHTPNFVRGVINLRGFVLPIIDLASRFGFPPTEPTAQHVIIVTQIANRTVGLLVDAVSDILTVTDDLVQPTPDIVSDMVETFVRGVFLARWPHDQPRRARRHRARFREGRGLSNTAQPKLQGDLTVGLAAGESGAARPGFQSDRRDPA